MLASKKHILKNATSIKNIDPEDPEEIDKIDNKTLKEFNNGLHILALAIGTRKLRYPLSGSAVRSGSDGIVTIF